ncbi:5343_t:CDS:1, partial [Entrophospora sp. SA101]
EPNLEVDDSDEEEMMVISDKEALNSLEKVIQYLKNTISYLSIILKTLGLRERKV